MAYVAKTKKRVYYKNVVVVEQSVNGTYPFTPENDVFTELTLVGAGAGGAFNSSSNRSSAAAGGSGSGCTIRAMLKAGVSYTAEVGKGGVVVGGLDATATGGRGGSTILKAGEDALITAEGGIGGNVWWPNGQSQGAPAPLPYVSDKWIAEPKVYYCYRGTVNNSGSPIPNDYLYLTTPQYAEGTEAYYKTGGEAATNADIDSLNLQEGRTYTQNENVLRVALAGLEEIWDEYERYPAGDLTADVGHFEEWLFAKQGIPGAIGGNPSAGGASVINGTTYGQGGQAWNVGGSSRGEVGKDGYIKVVYKQVVSEGEEYDDYEDIVKLHLAKTKKRVYYKYQFSDWTQPVLTSNGVWGGDSFAVKADSYYDNPRQPWNAFDGITGSNTANCWHSTSHATPWWIAWYNPKLLKISNIAITNRPSGDHVPTAFQIQVSDDGNTWNTVYTGTNSISAGNATWNIDLSSVDNVVSKYWRLYVTATTSNSYCVISEITCTAQQADIVEGTSEDYDFFNDVISCYAAKRKIRRYYKKQYQEFVQPVFTSDGTVGINFIGCANSIGTYYPNMLAWNAFDNNIDTWWFKNTGSAYIFSSSFNASVKPSSVTITNGKYNNRCTSPRDFTVQGSNDNSNWETIATYQNTNNTAGASWSVPITTDKEYRIFRLNVTSVNNGGDGPSIAEIKYNGQEFTGVIEVSASDDWDYYVDTEL